MRLLPIVLLLVAVLSCSGRDFGDHRPAGNAAIREAIHGAADVEGRSLVKADFEKVTRLSLGDNLISDLALLTDCKNLEKLIVYHNRITDLKPLAELSKLKELTLHKALRWPPGPS